MVLWTPGFLLCASFHLGQLLRRKCFHCHHFKMRSDKVRVAATKLLLLDVGESRRAMGLEEELAGIDGDELGDQAKQDHKETVLEACAKLAAKKGPVRRLQTHERQAWRAAVKAFFAAMPLRPATTLAAPTAFLLLKLMVCIGAGIAESNAKPLFAVKRRCFQSGGRLTGIQESLRGDDDSMVTHEPIIS